MLILRKILERCNFRLKVFEEYFFLNNRNFGQKLEFEILQNNNNSGQNIMNFLIMHFLSKINHKKFKFSSKIEIFMKNRNLFLKILKNIFS